MSQTNEKPLSRPLFQRWLLLLPLVLSAAAALLLTAMAPAAWGAADAQGLASWAPTVSALMLSLPALATSLWAILAVWRRTTGLFEVDLFGATGGAVSHWLAAISLVIFSGSMSAAESYRSLSIGGGTSTSGFIFLVCIFLTICGFLHVGLTMVYTWSITPGRRTRIAERAPDEPDFLEQWGRKR